MVNFIRFGWRATVSVPTKLYRRAFMYAIPVYAVQQGRRNKIIFYYFFYSTATIKSLIDIAYVWNSEGGG